MRKHSLAGKITFWMGFLFFIIGCSSLLGPMGYSSLVPNHTLAIVYIALGISLLLSSNFYKKENE
ncbi:hypothetical protein [Rossellomorea sp. BNER]|uniref:hypothetical protein n=1 Tax=Rossellomorea sp. BNER TaxID=2962031 RepID=UPI003AF21B3D|nr:hypothetical protein [Rossellomorea sp. BNER]